jgi:hypothetical protein
MKQGELNRAVARVTGDTLSTIKRLGFLLDDPLPSAEDADTSDMGPHVIDWDLLHAQRAEPPIGSQHREPALA